MDRRPQLFCIPQQDRFKPPKRVQDEGVFSCFAHVLGFVSKYVNFIALCTKSADNVFRYICLLQVVVQHVSISNVILRLLFLRFKQSLWPYKHSGLLHLWKPPQYGSLSRSSSFLRVASTEGFGPQYSVSPCLSYCSFFINTFPHEFKVLLIVFEHFDNLLSVRTEIFCSL